MEIESLKLRTDPASMLQKIAMTDSAGTLEKALERDLLNVKHGRPLPLRDFNWGRILRYPYNLNKPAFQGVGSVSGGSANTTMRPRQGVYLAFTGRETANMKTMGVLLISLLVLVTFTFSGHSAKAETYPSQPIQMVIPMAPGDTVDLTGRAIATEMAKILKTPVVPVNKAGGGGTIGADFVAKGKKDGYNLLFANSNIYYAHAMNPETVPYNPLTDLEPMCLAISTPLTVPVRSDSSWKTFQELVAYMKQNPGKIRGSSTGVGSVGHFNFEVIRSEAGTPITMVPYKGASPALTALLGGHVEMSTLSISLIAPHIKAGKIRALLISQKVPEFPDIPTLKQLGYKRDLASVRFAFYAPVGLPDSVKKILVPAMEKAIKSAEVTHTVRQLGALPDFVPGEQFKKMMAEEYGMVRQLLKTGAPEAK